MPDLADEAQSEHDMMIERGLSAIRSQFTSHGSTVCLHCGEPIPEQRRQLLVGVKTCVPCQERKEFQLKVGSPVLSERNMPGHTDLD